MKEYLHEKNREAKEKLKAIANGMCNRCFSHNLANDCHDKLYCPDCLVTEDDYIFRYERELPCCDPFIRPDLVLTKRQSDASRFLLELLSDRKSGNLFAVCGAGKTEMTYLVASEAIRRGMSVCYAIPRREVVRELAKRLRRDFKGIMIGEMHMEKKADEGCQIVVSTINQLINYYHEFGLVILDEADAFPYSGNEYLERLVKKAALPDAVFINMSATMTKGGIIDTYIVPERFHGFRLDKPRFVKTGNILETLKNGKLPARFESKLNLWLDSGKRVFVFVPTVELGKKVAKIMKNGKLPVDFLYAGNPARRRILNDFYMQKFAILVTTTVMERGVTYDDVQVAVLAADHPVFNKACLVQISGRAGRFKSHPSGEVVFYSETLTGQMMSCRREIARMNRLRNNSS